MFWNVSEIFLSSVVLPVISVRNNGSEFTAKLVRGLVWNGLQVKTLFIEPGSPWENGYIESFNGKLRDELLKRRDF